MRIITHGDLQELGQIFCPKCHCLFGYNKADVITQSHTVAPIDKQGRPLTQVVVQQEYFVKCPECEHMINIPGVEQ